MATTHLRPPIVDDAFGLGRIATADAQSAGCRVADGNSVVAGEPKYGMASTGSSRLVG